MIMFNLKWIELTFIIKRIHTSCNLLTTVFSFFQDFLHHFRTVTTSFGFLISRKESKKESEVLIQNKTFF